MSPLLKTNINLIMHKIKLGTWLALAAMLMVSCQRMEMTAPGFLVPKTVDQDASLPSLTVNGFQLHVESFGDPTDPLLILIHGGPGGDYRSMLQAKDLADDGFLVVCYDQIGSGLSQRVDASVLEEPGSLDVYFDNLGSLIDHFQRSDSQKVFLAGHSWGAMLASGFVNQYPNRVDGLVLGEPGGLTWPQTEEYLSRSNHIQFFSEALNNALYPEQMFAGRDEHEVLDYKAAQFTSFENAPGNAIGNAGIYPFWRNGAVIFNASIDYADTYGLDFTTHLEQFEPKVLFLYSELNTAYGREWAETVAAPYPNSEVLEVKGSGHEMFYFGWQDLYPKMLTYLTQMR